MKSAPAIAFDYRPCRGIGIAIAGMTAIALLAISRSGIGPAWIWPLGVFALVTGLHALYRHFHPDTVRIARTDGGWLLVDRAGEERAVSLAGHARRGWLLVLQFDGERVGRRSFVLTTDNLDPDLRRRLMLVLAAVARPARAERDAAQVRDSG